VRSGETVLNPATAVAAASVTSHRSGAPNQAGLGASTGSVRIIAASTADSERNRRMRFRLGAGLRIERSVDPRGHDLGVEMILGHVHLLT
jgi:hypothetical protein